MVAPAREIATRVLHRVAHDDAWATPTLDAELRRSSVSRVDAALATQIVYGTLRAAPDLDASLAKHARRPIKVDQIYLAVRTQQDVSWMKVSVIHPRLEHRAGFSSGESSCSADFVLIPGRRCRRGALEQIDCIA